MTGPGAFAERIDGVERIAVLRAGGLGDGLMTLPAVHALRASYPDAELSYIGDTWHDLLGHGRTPVDRTRCLPFAEGVRPRPGGMHPVDHDALADFLVAERAEGYDLAVQLHGGGCHSNPLALALGARCTIGMATPGAAPLDRSLRHAMVQPDVHRYLEVVALVGAAAVGFEPELRLLDTDLASAHAALAEGGRPRVAVHAGASDGRKCWPADRFAAVADALIGDGCEVVVVGTEVDRARDVLAAVSRPCVTAPPLGLGAFAALLSRCALLLGNDSGPRHLAQAVGTPTVAVFAATNAVNCAPLTRSEHRVCVSWNLECPECGSSSIGADCGHRSSFLVDVAVADVIEESRYLLAR